MSQTRARPSVSGRQLRKKQTDRSTLVVVGSIIAVIALAALGVAAYQLSRPQVQTFADVGSGQNNHLSTPDDPIPTPYNSNPPTSGWHWGGGAAPPGIKDAPVQDTITVHSLEHGFVIFHYRADLDQATVDKLKNLTLQLQQLNPCVILVPRPVENLDVPIAATAWTHLLKLNSYDEGALRDFFKNYVGRDNPEKICPVGI